MDIFIIQTGGTIDKVYPKTDGGYAFEIGESAAKRIIRRMKFPGRVHFLTACKKDSQDMTETDRIALAATIEECGAGGIIVTHGTDTMIETGRWLSSRIDRCVVLTGAFLPESFKASDADANLGAALAAVQLLNRGVYITMNGMIAEASMVVRKLSSDGVFDVTAL